MSHLKQLIHSFPKRLIKKSTNNSRVIWGRHSLWAWIPLNSELIKALEKISWRKEGKNQPLNSGLRRKSVDSAAIISFYNHHLHRWLRLLRWKKHKNAKKKPSEMISLKSLGSIEMLKRIINRKLVVLFSSAKQCGRMIFKNWTKLWKIIVKK